MKHYTHHKTGSWKSITDESFTIPGTDISAPGKVFLKEKAGLTSSEVSMNVFPPGGAMPFSHKHDKNEEIYIGVSGKGQFIIDGDKIEVGEGDVLRVASNAERIWRNVTSENFCFVCIQALEGSDTSSTIDDGSVVNPSFDWSSFE